MLYLSDESGRQQRSVMLFLTCFLHCIFYDENTFSLHQHKILNCTNVLNMVLNMVHV